MTHANVIADLTQNPLSATGEETANATHVTQAIEFGRMPRGTKGGKSTVMIAGRTSDGELVIVETTMALFLAAAKALETIDGLGEHRAN